MGTLFCTVGGKVINIYGVHVFIMYLGYYAVLRCSVVLQDTFFVQFLMFVFLVQCTTLFMQVCENIMLM